MRLEEALPLLREGKKIRRQIHHKEGYLWIEDEQLRFRFATTGELAGKRDSYLFDKEDVCADDWEEFIETVTFTEALEYAQNGGKIRRHAWRSRRYLFFNVTEILVDHNMDPVFLTKLDTFSDDWELIKED